MTDQPQPDYEFADGVLPDSFRYETSNPYNAGVKTLADALKPLPPHVPLVKSTISAKTLNLWYGDPGSHKSNLLYDMLVCIAAGKPWLTDQLGELPGRDTVQRPVLWIDVDNGEELVQERIAAFLKLHGVDCGPLYWHSFPDPPLAATSGLKQLAEHALDLGCGFIGMDNLLRVSGVEDENSSKMDTAMLALRKLVNMTGASVNVVHHKKKDNGMGGREGYSIRGHSSIEAGIDAGFLIKRPKESNTITVVQVKARRRPVDTFSANFVYSHMDDGETLATARMYGVPMIDADEERALEVEQKIVSYLIKAGPQNKSNIAQNISAQRQMVMSLVERMANVGRLSTAKAERGVLVYYVD